MSDIDPTQKNLKPTPESLQELYESPAGIPPVEKQDHHILVQRLNESIQTETAFVPEQHREDKLTATEPARSRKGLIAGGVAAVVGLGVAAALMLGGGDKEEKVAANPTPTTEEESTPTTEEDTTATTDQSTDTTESAPSSNEAIPGTSNVDLLNIPAGADTVTATRLNGEKITVPVISGETSVELANSAMALWACYQTTGSQECLEAFSDNEEVQDNLIAWRKEFVVPMLSLPENKDSQVVFFDDINDPVVFSNREDNLGREIVELQGGTLYVGRVINNFGSNEWQHPDIREFESLESTVQSLNFYIEQSENGGKTVTRFEYGFTPTEN